MTKSAILFWWVFVSVGYAQMKFAHFEPPPRTWYASQYRLLQKQENLTDQQLAERLVADADSSLKEETVQQREKSYSALVAMEALDTPEIKNALRKFSRQGATAETRAAALSSLLRMLPPQECLAEMRVAVTNFNGRELCSAAHAIEDRLINGNDEDQAKTFHQCLFLVVDSASDPQAVLNADFVLNRVVPGYSNSERHLGLVRKYAPVATGHAPFHMYLRQEARRLKVDLPQNAPAD